jgi:uncharacterized RDD family membrane protein YckC
MQQQRRDRSLGDGVYFAADDYIGVSRRIIILFVDTVMLGVMVWLLSVFWLYLVGDDKGLAGVVVFAIWLYLVPLKRSVFRTIGYRLMGVKLVNLKGQRPSLLLLTLRSLLWIFCLAPASFLFEFLWCSIDYDRQSIRDRITNTCLVKNDATPIGTGEVHLAYFFSFCCTLMFSHVVHPKPVDT